MLSNFDFAILAEFKIILNKLMSTSLYNIKKSSCRFNFALKNKNRLFGDIITFEMDLYSSTQIDTIEDFNFCSHVIAFLKDTNNEYEL